MLKKGMRYKKGNIKLYILHLKTISYLNEISENIFFFKDMMADVDVRQLTQTVRAALVTQDYSAIVSVLYMYMMSFIVTLISI